MADQTYTWELPKDLEAKVKAQPPKPPEKTYYEKFEELDQPLTNRVSVIKDWLDKLAQPGLNDSVTKAQLKGFIAGAIPAATKPSTVASVASLGSGTPAALAGGVLGAQGAVTATDPSKSKLERAMGAVGALGGGAQLAGGLMRSGGKGLKTIEDVMNWWKTPKATPPVAPKPLDPKTIAAVNKAEAAAEKIRLEEAASQAKAKDLANKNKTGEIIRDQKNLADVTKWAEKQKANKDAVKTAANAAQEAAVKLKEQEAAAAAKALDKTLKEQNASNIAEQRAKEMKDAEAAVERLRGEATEKQPPTYTESATTIKNGVKETASQKSTVPEPGNPDTTDYISPEDFAALRAARGEGGAPPAGSRGVGPRHPDAPPPNTPAGDMYDAWRAAGKDHKLANKLAAKGRVPQKSSMYPNAPVGEEPPVGSDEAMEALRRELNPEPAPGTNPPEPPPAEPTGGVPGPVPEPPPVPPAGPAPAAVEPPAVPPTPEPPAPAAPEPVSPDLMPPAAEPQAPAEGLSINQADIDKVTSAGGEPPKTVADLESALGQGGPTEPPALSGPTPASTIEGLMRGGDKPPEPRVLPPSKPRTAQDEWYDAYKAWLDEHPDYPKLADYDDPLEFGKAAEDYAKAKGGPPPHPGIAPLTEGLKPIEPDIDLPTGGAPEGVAPTEPPAPSQGVIPAAKPVDPAVAAARATEEQAAAAYREILARKAAGEQVGEAERGMAGRAAQAARIAREDAEDAAAGLPPRARGKGAKAGPKAPTEPASPVSEPSGEPVSGLPIGGEPEPPKGVSQTAKAREAAAAKRAAKRAEKEALHGKEQEELLKTEEGLEDDLRKIANYTPEERAAYIKKWLSGEEGGVDPQLAIRLALMAGGGAAGHEYDPLGNQTASTIAGAALGAAGPSIISSMMKANQPGGLGETIGKIYRSSPNFNRANMLISPRSLLGNAVVGPWGGAIMSMLEHGLSNSLERSGDNSGWRALGQLLQPHKFPIQMLKSGRKALDLVRNAEMAPERSGIAGLGDMNPKTLRGAFNLYNSIPAIPMVAGDEAARAIETAAGVSEDMAREYTLTNRARSSLGRGAKFFQSAKGLDAEGNPTVPGTLNQMMLPFVNTNANIMERTMERFPVFGLFNAARFGPAKQATMQRRLIQQGMGAAVGYASEQIGEQADPESAKFIRKMVTDGAGPYSGIAAIGFAVGQARRSGKNAGMAGMDALINQQPLPTTQSAKEYGKAIVNLVSGDFNFPKDVPRGLKPGFWPDANDVSFQTILDKLRQQPPEE